LPDAEGDGGALRLMKALDREGIGFDRGLQRLVRGGKGIQGGLERGVVAYGGSAEWRRRRKGGAGRRRG